MPSSQIDREKLTIRHMITIYCLGNQHGASGLCAECSAVLRYAYAQIEACSFAPGKKPACGLCRSNCFDRDMLRQFALIMRKAGPRMLMRHPLLTAAHFWDALRGGRG